MTKLDLNADLGEGAGADMDLLDIISSASIACGGHTGTPETIRQTLRAAKAKGATCGAHPGFADPEHFGRRRLEISTAELQKHLETQLFTIGAIAGEEGVEIRYLKLHGALANMAAEDEDIAISAFSVAKAWQPEIAILAMDNSAQLRAGDKLGLEVVREAYADRAYTREGLLVPRSRSGAVLTDSDEVVMRCLRLAEHAEIIAEDGTVIRSHARSLCLHGDTPNALKLARDIRNAFEQAGIEIRSPF